MGTGSIGRLAQRILSNVLRLRITTSDDSGPMQKLQVRLNELQTVDNVPHAFHFGLSSVAPDGSDAIVMFVGGDRGNGVVLGTNHADSRPKNLVAGESAVFNQVGIKIYLSKGGLVIEGAGLPITVNNAPTVTVNASTKVQLNTPELDVSGSIKAGQSISAGGDITDNTSSGGKSMANMRSVYDGHDHPIEGIQGGSSTVTSKKPNQQA